MADENPFGDPGDNPFADPAIKKSTTLSTPGTHDFNPFGQDAPTTPVSTPPPPVAASPTSSPAVLPPESPPSYSASAAVPPPISAKLPSYGTSEPAKITPYTPSYATDNMVDRREDLDRREADLRRQEEAFQSNRRTVARINNFPPLPPWCPVQPCFYQDFDIDIPVEFQALVKTTYYLWMAYAILLVVNVLASLTYFITTVSSNEKVTNSGVTFGVSLLFLFLGVPCSFVCWYRPVYKAFKSDSSINFFWFFFVFFFQFVVNIIFFVGFDGWGTVGLVSGLGIVTATSASMKAVGTMMILVGLMFALLAAANFVMLIRIHRVYRKTGASFEKAQADFARGVMSNKAVRNAAADAVSTGVKGAMTPDATQTTRGQGRY